MTDYKYSAEIQTSYDTDGLWVDDGEGNQDSVIYLADAIAICESADEEIERLRKIIASERDYQVRFNECVESAIDQLKSISGVKR